MNGKRALRAAAGVAAVAAVTFALLEYCPGKGGVEIAALPFATMTSSPRQAEIGRRLLQSRYLAANAHKRCAACHDPNAGYNDGQVHAGKTTRPITNLAWRKRFFADGHCTSLQDAVEEMITAADFAGAGTLSNSLERIRRDAALTGKYPEIATERFDERRMVGAVVEGVRSLRSREIRFDEHLAGRNAAEGAPPLDEVQLAGLEIFREKRCATCHGGEDMAF
ncbi:MAG: hypothetical protein IJ802_05450, partial [Kiritimatiellae bacterium]|nr:hypothetical protein [Kiritimatiellia bacterium]